MCGVAGYFNLDGRPAEEACLRAMVANIAHRGPDGEGYLTDGELALGHRRLAVIDTSEMGAQPMTTSDGRWTISFNGAIYNFPELRAELEQLGERFRSASDTEVLLVALARWGTDALCRLNGMFAFALWDRRERTLLLARDRYGIKPMYWCVAGNTFLFASEIKAFLEHPSFEAQMDVEALAEYLTFQNFFSDELLFKNVKTLPPGTFMRISEGTRDPVAKHFWDFDFQEPPVARSEDDYLQEFDEVFRRAVHRHLTADVPVGAYLSGGMDTGSITALAAQELPGMCTFTVGFDMRTVSGIELGFDERSNAEYLSYLFKTEQYEMVLKSGDMERAMTRLVWHLDEPRVGQSYPNYYAARLASGFAKVALSGTGGDELFGGYPWRYYRGVSQNGFEEYVDRYYDYWQRLIPSSLISKVMAPSISHFSSSTMRDKFRGVFQRRDREITRAEDCVNHSLYFEVKTFLHGLLTVEDKLAMAHGLEVRVPFLDNDLVDFAQRLPVGMKIRHLSEVMRINENDPGNKSEKYFERTQDGKYLLRKAMRQYIPDAVAWGKKQGFSAPDASWFKGESIDFVRNTLSRKDAMIYDYVDRSTLWGLVEDHVSGKVNRRLLIWSLLSLEYWCQIFLGGRRPVERPNLVCR